MIENDFVKETENLNENNVLNEVRKKTLDSYKNYRNMMHYLSADAPIGVLCLPKSTENLLINNGFLRVYDIFDRDLTEIKGLTNTGIDLITARLNNFLSMS